MHARHRGLIAATAAALTLAFAPSAQATPAWSDGLYQDSSITNCVSIIQGTPYQEVGTRTYTGQFVDPGALPGVNQTFYTHIVFVGLGNSCAGQRAHIEIQPPSGVSLAITAGTPVYCYGLNFNANPPTATQEVTGCPQSPQPSLGYGGTASFDSVNPSQTWPLPPGYGWELQIPFTSNRVLNGGFGACADCMGYAVKLLDGNSSPVLSPHQGLFVAASGGGGGTPGGSGGAPGGSGSGGNTGSGPTAVPAVPAVPAKKKCKPKKRSASAAKKKCKK